MKKINTLLILILCVSVTFAQKITVDMDESADFTQFKTYEFLGWQADSDSILNDFDKKRLRDSFSNEFSARNLEPVDSGADLAISLFIVVSLETSVTAYTDYHGGTGYRYGRRGYGWGNGYSTTTYSENDYLKGTLVIDVFDAESKELIWQGVATGTVKENPKKRDKSIPKTVGKLMKKFPIPKAD